MTAIRPDYTGRNALLERVDVCLLGSSAFPRLVCILDYTPEIFSPPPSKAQRDGRLLVSQYQTPQLFSSYRVGFCYRTPFPISRSSDPGLTLKLRSTEREKKVKIKLVLKKKKKGRKTQTLETLSILPLFFLSWCVRYSNLYLLCIHFLRGVKVTVVFSTTKRVRSTFSWSVAVTPWKDNSVAVTVRLKDHRVSK